MVNPKTFYLVDDDNDDLDFFCEAVDSIDETIICIKAPNSELALHSFKTHDIPVPDLIFLDLNMPLVDGRTFLKQIKLIQPYSSVPVIIYSTSSNQKDREDAMQLGASDFITKPHTMKKLVSDLSGVLSTYWNDAPVFR
jgi:DNA-binding response OmpR family regulator